MQPELNSSEVNSQTLDERISALHKSLSPKHKRLARFVLDNKYFISFASASQAGEKIGTSAATVVRFAQTIGYEGYSEMQAAIRAELPSYMTAIVRMQVQLQAKQPSNDLLRSVYQADINNIQRTVSNISEEKLNAALETLVNANRILVVGAGLSSSCAMFLAHSLKIIGRDARVNSNEGLSLAADIALLNPGDLLIAIDMWRYVRSTIQAVSKAKEMGVSVIAITDSIVSPLARLADYAFEVVTSGISHSLSATAIMSLLNVFIAALSYKIPEQTMRSLRRVDSAYRDNDLLVLE